MDLFFLSYTFNIITKLTLIHTMYNIYIYIFVNIYL